MVRPLRAGEFGLCFFFQTCFSYCSIQWAKEFITSLGLPSSGRKKNWPVQSRPCTAVIYLESAIKKTCWSKKAISILEMRDQFKSFHGKIIKVQF